MGSASSRPKDEAEISDKVARKGIPHTFQMTYSNSRSQIIIHISAPDSNPVYSVVIPKEKGRRTVLYYSRSVRPHPMVYAKRKHHEFFINLPAIPSCGFMACKATMRYEKTITERYYFTLMVGHHNRYRNEAFEWRRKDGSKHKGSGKSPSEWQLLRLGPPTRGAVTGHSEKSGAISNQNKTQGSDEGGEVVAKFTMVNDLSMFNIGGFQYRGSGTKKEIGYHWALTAAVSAICIFQHQMRI